MPWSSQAPSGRSMPSLTTSCLLEGRASGPQRRERSWRERRAVCMSASPITWAAGCARYCPAERWRASTPTSLCRTEYRPMPSSWPAAAPLYSRRPAVRTMPSLSLLRLQGALRSHRLSSGVTLERRGSSARATLADWWRLRRRSLCQSSSALLCTHTNDCPRPSAPRQSRHLWRSSCRRWRSNTAILACGALTASCGSASRCGRAIRPSSTLASATLSRTTTVRPYRRTSRRVAWLPLGGG
mmetsp:Transcript_11581/g.35832  ORF Transcript_11581/g.35832 Transcript_11581/m.35832 type:complete len:242 (-) Transcript_11581:202-927(-)